MAKDKVAKKSTGAKKMTPYNKFMKTELARSRKLLLVLLTKTKKKGWRAFKKAASNWATAKENPKNAK
ncbi:unnamed protein product [Cunninghamella echinulata]